MTKFTIRDPNTGESIGAEFTRSSTAELNEACLHAEAAFDTYRETAIEHRARFLEGIATQIEALGDRLITCAMAETALPRLRLEGERARTCGQLRLFAATVRRGDWQSVRIDHAMPDRKPLPRPDLRFRRIPLGPVAVFGASNFPLAFSVAGGDTASALAAGCPVIVKAHPAHPGTSELAGSAISKAVSESNLPAGVFSLLFDDGFEIGEALVKHPAIQAVGFTGSRRGGLALVALGQNRHQPIPVYAEMSSVNPVFLLPGALSTRAEALATAFVDSMTAGVGQFCTNPGILLAIKSPALDIFKSVAAAALAGKPADTMLSAGIAKAFRDATARLAHDPNVRTLAQGQAADFGGKAQPALFITQGASILAEPSLLEEVFGPSSLLIVCEDEAELLAVASAFDGQLTATLQLDDADHRIAHCLLPILERRAGRILFNGWPTGVEVSEAMVHGGPFPATSDSRSTSVGTAAIERFLRPVCYQSMPEALLPAPLHDANTLHLRRFIDGSWTS